MRSAVWSWSATALGELPPHAATSTTAATTPKAFTAIETSVDGGTVPHASPGSTESLGRRRKRAADEQVRDQTYVPRTGST